MGGATPSRGSQWTIVERVLLPDRAGASARTWPLPVARRRAQATPQRSSNAADEGGRRAAIPPPIPRVRRGRRWDSTSDVFPDCPPPDLERLRGEHKPLRWPCRAGWRRKRFPVPPCHSTPGAACRGDEAEVPMDTGRRAREIPGAWTHTAPSASSGTMAAGEMVSASRADPGAVTHASRTPGRGSVRAGLGSSPGCTS